MLRKIISSSTNKSFPLLRILKDNRPALYSSVKNSLTSSYNFYQTPQSPGVLRWFTTSTTTNPTESEDNASESEKRKGFLWKRREVIRDRRSIVIQSLVYMSLFGLLLLLQLYMEDMLLSQPSILQPIFTMIDACESDFHEKISKIAIQVHAMYINILFIHSKRLEKFLGPNFILLSQENTLVDSKNREFPEIDDDEFDLKELLQELNVEMNQRLQLLTEPIDETELDSNLPPRTGSEAENPPKFLAKRQALDQYFDFTEIDHHSNYVFVGNGRFVSIKFLYKIPPTYFAQLLEKFLLTDNRLDVVKEDLNPKVEAVETVGKDVQDLFDQFSTNSNESTASMIKRLNSSIKPLKSLLNISFAVVTVGVTEESVLGPSQPVLIPKAAQIILNSFPLEYDSENQLTMGKDTIASDITTLLKVNLDDIFDEEV